MIDIWTNEECQPFLNLIRQHPEADAPRLVFSQWLADCGEMALAEFIAVQVELANPKHWTKAGNLRINRSRSKNLRARSAALLAETTPEPCPRCNKTGMHRYYPDLGGEPNYSDSATCGDCDGTLIVNRSNCIRWAGKLGGREAGEKADKSEWDVGWFIGDTNPKQLILGRFVRGFVGHVSLSTAALMGERCQACEQGGDLENCFYCHGTGRVGGLAADLARFPLEPDGVELSDKRPADRLDVNSSCYWFRDVRGENGTESHLPDVLFNLLPGGSKETVGLPYASAELAASSLRRAATEFVRKVGTQTAAAPQGKIRG